MKIATHWSVARKLSDWTYKNLKWKRVDDASADQTLATREADCLEFSQLFVAMARSLGRLLGANRKRSGLLGRFVRGPCLGLRSGPVSGSSF